MKCIIGGSRTIMDPREVILAIKEGQKAIGQPITLVLSGAASGPDTLGAAIAKELGIPVEFHPAPWNSINPATNRPYGRRAGFVRNQRMVNLADAVIAVWDGQSRGTQSLILLATQKGIPVHVHRANATYKALEEQPVNQGELSLTGPEL